MKRGERIVQLLSIFSLEKSELTLTHIAALYEFMSDNQDENNAGKILELYEKKMKDEKVIGFAGHFSAGKSSMINALMGEEILPKSPIPTSANIVKLTSGEGVARIFFHQDDPIEYNEPYDFGIIKNYCKDKDAISKIELSTSKNVIPRNSVIFDTPGIDAADDTDRLITESSLHLIDYLFYVVDYNHVQSEVNLQFLQSIQKMNIPYYLIINQVDKHNEQEIPFSVFKNNIKQTFDQWQVKPIDIYFTSLLDYSAKYNQFAELKNIVFTLLNSNTESVSRIENSVKQLVESHEIFLNDSFEESVDQLNLGEQEPDQNRLDRLNDEIEKINNKPNNIESHFRMTLNQTFKNAYLMPANLREKARLFLESQQKDFKVGWFGSKKKTKIEKERRTEVFFNSLQESIEAHLHWKVRDKLQQLVKEYHLETSILMHEIQNIKIIYTINDLQNLTKSGATVNGDYVLNYTNDVSANIIQKYKRKLNSIFQLIYDLTEKKWAETLTHYKEEQKDLEKAVEDSKVVADLERDLKSKLTELNNQLLNPKITESVLEELERKINEKYDSISKADTLNHLTTDSNVIKSKNIDTSRLNNNKQSAESTIQSIDETMTIINNLPGFESVISELKNSRERLNNREFTIALFGAFSAGKSSFANALLGSRLLPTSPNPTTAVINKITAPTQTDVHGTVKIKLKNESTLINDIKPIVKSVSKKSQELTEFTSMIEWIKNNNGNIKKHISKIHQSFLQALLSGYADNKKVIGEKIEIDLKNFSEYVTDETKACYIEEVTVYYDCPITNKGITLVDTPGADSINARHTNVSFDYIKYADSILYVTYYNHALSRADKDFLLQLGRVKEAFELDKMNFIINAADLATDQDELDLVSNYVEEQLLELGIRQPKIYTLSSKKALEDLLNQRKNNQMAKFKNDLFNFIEFELTGLIIQSAFHEMNRAKHILANYIDTASLDVKQQEQLRIDLLKAQEEMEAAIHDLPNDLYINRLEQKISKQLYYVEDRLSIRFHDMFKEHFNPTTINETGRKAKLQLENSMQKLLDYTGYELLQEIRAVALRMEAYMRDLFQEADSGLETDTNKIDPNFIASSATEPEWETPNFDMAFKEMNVDVFETDLAIFKGTKSFFVKNEKDIMKEAIYQTLVPYIKDYIVDAESSMNQSYSAQWQKGMEDRKNGMRTEVSSFVDNSLEIMGTATNVNELKRKYTEMSTILL